MYGQFLVANAPTDRTTLLKIWKKNQDKDNLIEV